MGGNTVLNALRAAGISVSLGDLNTIKVTPATLLTPVLREQIRANKFNLILALSTLETEDTRVSCSRCQHLKFGNKCNNHFQAAITPHELAVDFINLPQHCTGFTPLVERAPP